MSKNVHLLTRCQNRTGGLQKRAREKLPEGGFCRPLTCKSQPTSTPTATNSLSFSNQRRHWEFVFRATRRRRREQERLSGSGPTKKKTWSISDLSCLFARHFVESQTHSLRQFFSLFLKLFSLFLFVSLFVVSVVLLPKMSGPRSYSFDWRSVLENCNRSNALMYPLAYRGNIIAPLMCARLAFKKSSLFGDAGLVCLEACSVFVLPGQRRGFKSYARGFERHREPSQNSRIDCTRSTSPEGARPTSAGDAAAARSYNPSRSRVINSRRYFTFHPPNPMAYALFRTPTYPTQFSLFQFEFRSNQNFALSPLTFSCLPPLKISLGDERP